MGKSIAIVCLVVLLIVSNAWQFYEAVDQGVTMSYMDGELYRLRNTRDELEKILTHYVRDTSVKDMEALLIRLLPDSEPFVKEDHINSGFLSFKLDRANERVESVGYDPET